MQMKRKKIWIDRFQTNLSLRLAMYFVLYMITVLSWVAVDRVTASLIEAHFGQAAVSWSVMSASVVVLVGFLFIYDMMRFSHRFVGPLYRFRQCLRAIADGEDLALMKLREGDFLQELKDEFNEALKALEQRGALKIKTNAAPEDQNEEHKEAISAA